MSGQQQIDVNALTAAGEVQPPARDIPISPAVSIFLDVARFLLAAVVAIGHITEYTRSDWPDLSNYGVLSVGGFFVLSGLTIRALTLNRTAAGAAAGAKYAIDRSTRLVSVVMIGLLVTIVCDSISAAVNPRYYWPNWGTYSSHPAARIVVNLLMFNQPYGHDYLPFSNQPFWSLGYESGFYLMYGLFIFTRNRLRALLYALIAAALYGPNVVLMLPCWLLGVYLYDSACGRHSAAVNSLGARIWLGGGLLLAIAAFVHWHPSFPALDAAIPRFFAPLHVATGRISAELVVGSALFFLFAKLAIVIIRRREGRWRINPRVAAGARFLGELTFPLYVIHLPVFVLATALHIYDPQSSVQKLMLFVVFLLLAAVAADAGNGLKASMRRLLRPKAVALPAA